MNTISLCDGFSQGHVGMCSVLPSREVIADSIEVYAGGHQLDGLCSSAAAIRLCRL